LKRRVRTQPTNPFYSNEPAVARNLIAGKALVQNASLGNQPPKMVDKKPGRLSGVAGFESKKHPTAKPAHLGEGKNPSAGKAPGAAKFPSQGGHLKASGHPGAHRLGGIKPIKLKV
jgi:hypothetical protein